MAEFILFGFSAFLALILTNLDNLAALVALILVSGDKRAVFGFLFAQGLVISASLLFAMGIEGVIPGWAGYLGMIPLTLGCLAAIRQWRGQGVDTPAHLEAGASILVTTLLFTSLSMDTLAVLAPLLADSTPTFRIAGGLGAGLAVVGLATLALLGAKSPLISGRIARKLEMLVPYVMICAGLYILSNSWTDAV
ncbi:cadmium resistance transporter [Ruegeria faecimaris]|uniref:Cadmium resistance protein CadD, predicted permease n=1 Tax=Ruegeria faecimaris TaxID=686389 RepID=A0A521B5W9_9RHOB|nr:hypothetical protein [Ruegeria faecimaris]SMO42453.1 Cadmium resistance protein CadD, predicted permease [Ruegeria faecimaris]